MRNIMRKVSVSAAAGLLLLLAGCSAGSNLPPTATPDVPILSSDEVIANVQTRMKTTVARMQRDSSESCYQTIQRTGWDEAVAAYEGNGRWTVTVGENWGWTYFERTNLILSRQAGTQPRYNC